jgi:hypothetical protein
MKWQKKWYSFDEEEKPDQQKKNSTQSLNLNEITEAEETLDISYADVKS